MNIKEWDRLRKTPEARALREAAVAWVTREGGDTITDARLMEAAIALATLAARRDAPGNVGGRARKLLADMTVEVSRFEGFELLLHDAIRSRDEALAALSTSKKRTKK